MLSSTCYILSDEFSIPLSSGGFIIWLGAIYKHLLSIIKIVIPILFNPSGGIYPLYSSVDSRNPLTLRVKGIKRIFNHLNYDYHICTCIYIPFNMSIVSTSHLVYSRSIFITIINCYYSIAV